MKLSWVADEHHRLFLDDAVEEDGYMKNIVLDLSPADLEDYKRVEAEHEVWQKRLEALLKAANYGR